MKTFVYIDKGSTNLALHRDRVHKGNVTNEFLDDERLIIWSFNGVKGSLQAVDSNLHLLAQVEK